MELDLKSSAYASLTDRLQFLHDRMLEIAPGLARVACALYDPSDDRLKTYINSTRGSTSQLHAYEYRLADSVSLSELARTGATRLLSDVPHEITPDTAHSAYVLGEGFRSSFTVPLSFRDTFLGFLFFDSREPGTFTATVQRELLLYAQLLGMAIANELLAVRSIVSTVRVAKDFTALRDVETGAHLERMSRYAALITRVLADELDLSDEFVEQVFLYAPLHDIGKVAIPDAILLKPGPLDPDEWEVMKTHTVRGGEMVAQISRELGLDVSLDTTVLHNIVVSHHERPDGSGYPAGLAGDAVPLEARIVAVADIYDALTSRRPYKPAWSLEQADIELQRLVRRERLDARCVAALRSEPERVAEIRERHAES